MLIKHEEKYCARCNRLFECKAGDIAKCQCNQEVLLPETTDFLQKTSYGCLCRYCLSEINQMVKFDKTCPLPGQRDLLIQGLHYYIENGYWVFTELYHLQKGYCCGNGCRHCAYGYHSKKPHTN